MNAICLTLLYSLLATHTHWLLGTDAKLYPIDFRLPLAGQVSLPGTPWPKPHSMNTTHQTLTIDPKRFLLTSNLQTDCVVIENALKRYADIIFSNPNYVPNEHKALLNNVHVEVPSNADCGYPKHDDEERYSIQVPHGHAQAALIRSKTVWGALRGLETFSQLVYANEHKQLLINETTIHDHPRYGYRGMLVDTARHYLPKRTLLANLDAMAYNKFNVFHWHLVDDQSFPYVSIKFPNISKFGAYSPKHIYTQRDVQDVIEYARMRGIRVVPEIDTPGHTHGMARAYPDLLTPCYGQDGKPYTPHYPLFPESDVLNPYNPESYNFMKELFAEFKKVFKDDYIHLGMDEVSYECWKSNPYIAKFMKQYNLTHLNQVEQFYVNKTIANVKEVGYKYIMWQDPVDNNVTLANDSIVIVWKDKYLDSSMDLWQNYISRIAKHKYQMVLSACWYLNYISYPYPGMDWEKYYKCDPIDFDGSHSEKKLVIGGEACIWGEFVDATNLLSRLWPRASAVAERLWSKREDTQDVDTARHRLDQHRCRMVQRGIPAAPILNGYCGDYEWDMDKEIGLDNMGQRVRL